MRPASVLYVTAFTIVLLRMFTLKVNWEIRYRTELARRIFPGNGPVSIARILRRRGVKTEKAQKTTKSAARLRRAPGPASFAANEEALRVQSRATEKSANLPSADPSKKPGK